MSDAQRAGTPVSMTTDYTMLLPSEVVDRFRARIRGEVIESRHETYEAARRIWNGMIDKRPALIVRCRGTADVAATIGLARERSLPISVRGGGHNVSGNALCEGIVADLSLMNSVRVDPVRRVVRVGGGATLGDIDHETQAFGLAVPTGLVSRTGVAGLALHGGIGLLMRKHGLTSDNLVGADVVTADGTLHIVNETQDPDLFWALRGGGGNFGVVTSFEFRAHRVGPDVWMAMVLYPVESAPRVLRTFRELMEQAPDELVAFCSLWNAGHDEPIPQEHRGVPVIVAAACYSGPVAQGEAAVAPLRHVDAPLVDLSGPMAFQTVQSLFDPEYPDGRRYYWKSTYLARLDDEVIEVLARHASARPSPLTSLDIIALGGAVARVPSADTAFGVRHAPYLLAIESNWDDPAADDANVGWARRVFEDVQRFSTGGSYLNFPGFGEEGEALVRESYGDNYARLQTVKARYDPGNLFRSNLNIPVRA